MRRFEGKIALVTGAGSGIGRAVTVRIVDEGGTVFAVDVNETTLRETAVLAGGKVRTHVADVGEPDACVAVVASCVEESGGLHVLGNVAGIYRAAHTPDMSREDYRRVMSVNLDGPFYLCQAAIPHLLESGGNIVNIASNSGIQGVPYSAAYSASKGGIVQLTRSLAVEFLKTTLRVNAIAPAGTNTNIAASANFPPDMDPVLSGRMAGLRGLAEPGDVAALFAYLASDEARAVTGAVYTIDNGITVS
ncbi:MAG TPA: SDR family oxidoreductase [Acidimicrobiales bacterium]|nr:SDR family oxidoreductase [Acidimicrobiales bacterium]